MKSISAQKNENKGFSLVEIVLAIGLMAIILPALLTGYVASRESKPQRNNRTIAIGLLKEAEEALRVVREAGWSNISTAGTYYPAQSGSTWALQSGTETNGIYTRQIVISDVQRDSNGDIVASGGTVDPSTKQVSITVSWSNPIAASVTSQTYLTRYLQNTTWTQTTTTEFNAGTNTNTTVTTTTNGEVELDISSGGSDWSSPVLSDTYDNPGNGDGYNIVVAGDYAYLATTDTGSNGDVTVLDISDPTNIIETGFIDLGANIYDIAKSGDYIFAATASNNEEVMVIDVSTPSNPTKVGSADLGGNRDAYSIFISGTTAYVGKDEARRSDREFFTLNISTPTSPNVLASFEIGADVNDITVSGNYAYIATDSDSSEMQVINVSNPSSPSIVTTYNTSGTGDGRAVFLDGTNLYVGTSDNPGGTDPDLIMLDVSNPSSPSLLGTYDAGDDVNDVYVEGTLAFLATANSTAELIVLDISTPSSITLEGTYDHTDAATGVIHIDGEAFMSTEGNSSEFIIISATGGGGGYQTSGTFESQTFDAGTAVSFNYVEFNFTEPANTDINWQVGVSNSDPPTAFVGPDGTSGTYYETAGSFNLANVEGQYLRVRAYFSGDGTDTPILEDFVVNYSP